MYVSMYVCMSTDPGYKQAHTLINWLPTNGLSAVIIYTDPGLYELVCTLVSSLLTGN